MSGFEDFKINKQLLRAVEDLKYETPTEIQEKAFPVVMSGKDVVGISQTGTGKTLAYLLPILQQTNYSKQNKPRVLILVPTRELVIQVVKNVEELIKYMSLRVLGLYGESNIEKQRQYLAEGQDIIVATPGRFYDLILNHSVAVKEIKKLVIDEVDVMLDLGFRTQVGHILDLLPRKRQNIMFSATMTLDVDYLIDDYFTLPEKIAVALSGTPLDNITQTSYFVPNFNTKANLLANLILDEKSFTKVLVFASNKKTADRLYTRLEEDWGSSICIVHANKSQNYRIRSVDAFESGSKRIMIATDVMARGLDLDKISHVVSFDTPRFPENYMHRIGRTGRAEQEGKSILLYSEKEEKRKLAIESLMNMDVEVLPVPENVEISKEFLPEELETHPDGHPNRNLKKKAPVKDAEKLEKNRKINLGGSYKKAKINKYKKPRTRGDKNANKKKR